MPGGPPHEESPCRTGRGSLIPRRPFVAHPVVETEKRSQMTLETKYQVQQSDLKAGPKATDFHVFERDGHYYLFEVASSSVFEISEPIHRAITVYRELRERPEADRDQSDVELLGNLEAAAQTFADLREAGFFTQPPCDKFEYSEQYARRCLTMKPRKMWLLVVQSCNLRCHYCYGIDNRYEDRGGLMSEEVAKAAVDLLVRRSGRRKFLRIVFFGGEPALNMPVVRSTVEYARKVGARTNKHFGFSMSTNGILLTDDDIEFCVKHGFAMQFSLDGDEEGHNLHRVRANGEGTYKLAVEAIRRYLARCNPQDPPKIRATMTPGNHDPQQIVEHFQSLGFTYHGVGSSQACADGPCEWDLVGEALSDVQRQLDEHARNILRCAERGEKFPAYNPFFPGFPTLNMWAPSLIGCGVGRNDTGVDTRGRLFPCHRYVGMNAHVIGDVWSGIDSDAAMKYYSDLLGCYQSTCRSCWARVLCSGNCPWTLAHRAGGHSASSEQECAFVRHSYERMLHLYFRVKTDHPDLFESLTTPSPPEEADK
jgi:uncharacterized protein